jgi:hypothetical protein
MKRPWYLLCGLGMVGTALLSACVGQTASYDWKMPFRDKAALKNFHQVLLDVHAREGVTIPKVTLDRLSQRLGKSFRTASGNKLIPVSLEGAEEGTLAVQVYITRYDDGLALSKWAFTEPGSMHIDGEVTLSDWESKEKLAVFDVSQEYDRTRTFGGLESIEQLEPQFTEGVVAGITQQAQ